MIHVANFKQWDKVIVVEVYVKKLEMLLAQFPKILEKQVLKYFMNGLVRWLEGGFIFMIIHKVN